MNRTVYNLLSSDFGARFELRTLIRRTAKTFGVDVPKTAGQTTEQLLGIYAQLTSDAAMHALQTEQDPELLHQRLYRMTYRLGCSLRRWLRPQNEQECAAILVALYRNIGITISEEGEREFCVHKCYFSSFYTPEVCSVISAIDQGIFAGIYQGGKLVFRERITEGHEVCSAYMQGR